MTTLIDIASGDTFTIAYLDSLEVRDPHALVVSTVDGELSTHGPFDGEPTSHAPHLAMSDATVAATRPMPLHHPDQPALPDDAWLPVPADLAHVARPALADARAAALVLLDRSRCMLTVVGPVRRPHRRRNLAADSPPRPHRRPAHRGATPRPTAAGTA